MAVFVMFTAGRFCGAGPVRRRTWLGLSGMATALAAVAAAYGANSGLSKYIHNPERTDPLYKKENTTIRCSKKARYVISPVFR